MPPSRLHAQGDQSGPIRGRPERIRPDRGARGVNCMATGADLERAAARVRQPDAIEPVNECVATPYHGDVFADGRSMDAATPDQHCGEGDAVRCSTALVHASHRSTMAGGATVAMPSFKQRPPEARKVRAAAVDA